jgi:hypothetical protein
MNASADFTMAFLGIMGTCRRVGYSTAWAGIIIQAPRHQDLSRQLARQQIGLRHQPTQALAISVFL